MKSQTTTQHHSRFRLLTLPMLTGWLLALGVGCHQRPEVTTYTLTGVVRKVDKDAGSVTIRHDAIPGFMDAMTMPFNVKDKVLLDDLRPGDEVEGSLRVISEDGLVRNYELTELRVTRPAPPPALKLSLSRGTPALNQAPKVLEPGQSVPDFRMTTQEGRRLALSDLRGKVVVLTFIYTRCPLPDFCPLMDRKFAEVVDHLRAFPERAEHVRFLSVSFDPEHDTPDVLLQHAQRVGAKPPLWTFAVASHGELAKVAGPLGLTYGPTEQEIIHNLCTAVIDPEGRLALLEVGTAPKRGKPADLLKPIYVLIKQSRASGPQSKK